MNDVSPRSIIKVPLVLLLGAAAPWIFVAGTGRAQDRPAPATRPALTPPRLDADRPADYPGLHNVVAYAAGVYSGSVPEGAAGFETLQKLGVRTVISVDGALPDLELAKARGLRYVHLPIGYNGMSEERKLEIARAVRDLPGPVYIHCHHGKHRSAGAAGAALVTLGDITPEAAQKRMKVSGTSPNYKGLYQCVASAAPVTTETLNRVSAAFPEISRPSGMVKSMTEIDEVTELLKLIQKAGWKAPRNHPDLVPAAEAGRLADLFRHLTVDEQVRQKPKEFAQWLLDASEDITAIEEALAKGDPPADLLNKRWERVVKSCTDCHVKYRD